MKSIILKIIFFLAFLVLISEAQGYWLIKIISISYIYLFCKANKYFY